MEIRLGAFLNLMNNHPVFDGDTLSHQTMKELISAGLAEKSANGSNIPTRQGHIIYNKLLCQNIKVEERVVFTFNELNQLP